MGPTVSRLTSLSFHVNRASHSWVTTFSKFDLENQGWRWWVRSQFKLIMGLTSYRLTSLSFHVNRPSHSWEFSIFKIWPWKSRVKVKLPWCCTTTGLDNSMELRTENIRQVVTEIWVPQVWQLPACPPTRTVTTIPLQPRGLRGKNCEPVPCYGPFPPLYNTLGV